MDKIKFSNTARALIAIEDYFVFIKRTKYKNEIVTNEYYTFPGGHLEKNETFEQACIRELKEELDIDVKVLNLIMEYKNNDIKKFEKFFNVQIISGKIKKGNGEEFTNIDIQKYGDYEIVFINKNDIVNYNILPIEMKNYILNSICKKNIKN